MAVITLSRRFEKKSLDVPRKSVYLDKFSGEWFVAPKKYDPLIQRLYKGVDKAFLSSLPADALALLSGLARDGVLGEDSAPATSASPERDKVTLVIIETLNFCNLACTYCFEDVPTKGKKMTFETAEAIVESLQKLNLADSFVVEFNGGESFMNLRTLEYVVRCVMASPISKTHRVSYGVTTNLTFLNKEIIAFLRENDFSVSVSLDGVREDHDRHRLFVSGSGSHDRVLQNMAMLRDSGIEFSTVSVISQPGQLTRAYAFLKEKRIPYVSFAIRRHSERMPLTDVDYQAIAVELSDAFVDSFENFKAHRFAPKVMDAVIMIKNLIMPHDPQYMCLRTPCGAGTNMITYDTSGDVYACQDLIKQPEFKICSASDPNPQTLINENQVVKRLRARKPGDNRGCEQCDFQMFCQGGCYSTSFYASDKRLTDSFTTKTPHCEFYYAAFTHLLSVVARNSNLLPEYIQSTPYLCS